MILALASGKPMLPLSIDYTGGTVLGIAFANAVTPTDVRQIFVEAGYGDTVVYNVVDNNTVGNC